MHQSDPSEPPRSLGEGTVFSWLDDITVATGSAAFGLGVRGHCRLLDRVFKRLIAAGMTLKGSKAHLLRQDLEVLGFIVTPDGTHPNPEKVTAISRMPSVIANQKELLRFLGCINFQRRFICRLGHIAAPLYEMLRKEAVLKWDWTPRHTAAVNELKAALSNHTLLSHPDLRDPRASMVIMTDASDVAAGAVLMQWQKTPAYPGEPPDLDLPEGATQDDFLRQHRLRLIDGYRLVVLGYYSKSFSGPQLNWAIYDKEAASILLALRQWYRLVAARETTVYTDNTVAARRGQHPL